MKFEYIMNHPFKGLTGLDLSNSIGHDEIIMIRTVEMNKDKIADDSVILSDEKIEMKMKYVYREYCDTVVNLDNIKTEVFREAINLALLHA